MKYAISKSGCRLEVTDSTVDVRVRFRGSVSIPLAAVTSVGVGRWRHVDTLQLETAEGTYEWSFGDRTNEVANVIREAIAPMSAASPR